MSVFVPLAVFALACALYGFLLKHRGLKGLTVERRFSSPAVYEGDTGEMTEVVRNDSFLPVPLLRVESRVPAGILMDAGRAKAEKGNAYHRSVFALMPYQQIIRRHTVVFAKRGSYDLGNAALTAEDLLGFTVCSKDQQMRVPILVYPRLPDDSELPAPLAYLTGDLKGGRSLFDDPFWYRGISEYVPGDPVRDIHWPATARAGHMMVRRHDRSVGMKLMCVINCQLKADQWDDLMDYEQAPVERAVSLAAGLCVSMLRAGMEAGFCANMPEGEEQKPVLYPPAAGPGRETELLSAFARLRIRRVLSFTEFLRSLEADDHTDIVIFTCYGSADDEEQAERLRKTGCRVTVYRTDEEEMAE